MLDLTGTLDEEGYPTEDTERIISEWEGNNKELMDAIHGIWQFPNWGWHEKETHDEMFLKTKVQQYSISTGGWSGNEQIIDSLESNRMFWLFNWVQSTRGGHYIFEVKL